MYHAIPTKRRHGVWCLWDGWVGRAAGHVTVATHEYHFMVEGWLGWVTRILTYTL